MYLYTYSHKYLYLIIQIYVHKSMRCQNIYIHVNMKKMHISYVCKYTYQNMHKYKLKESNQHMNTFIFI